MRQHKYRAWDTESKKMLSWEWIQHHPLFWFFGEQTKLIPLEYTGLHDKNGREIYEGDIVSFEKRGEIRRMVIEYNEGWCIWEPLSWEPIPGHSACPYEYEVIGNIYENPELLDEPIPVKGE